MTLKLFVARVGNAVAETPRSRERGGSHVTAHPFLEKKRYVGIGCVAGSAEIDPREYDDHSVKPKISKPKDARSMEVGL